MGDGTKRGSLTVLQFNALSELLVLWDRIKEDGKVSKDELVLLGNWIRRQADVKFARLDEVRVLFRRIVEDGRVTRAELSELWALIDDLRTQAEESTIDCGLPELSTAAADSEVGESTSANSHVLRRTDSSSRPLIELDPEKQYVRFGKITWSWSEITARIFKPRRGDCYKCFGTGVLAIADQHEKCWQCEGTGWYKRGDDAASEGGDDAASEGFWGEFFMGP